MNHETLVKTINLIIAPVVMITTCGIILNGIIARYTWLSDRIRSIHEEQLSLLELDLTQHQAKAEKLHHLNHLLPNLLKHHHQVHHVLVLVYLAILVFMLDMLVIAFAIANNSEWLQQIVVIVFLLGISVLLLGMALIADELRSSHQLIQLEVHHQCQSCKINFRK